MANFTYNKQKRRWYRQDGSMVKPGNRVLGQNGNYYQYNTDGSVTKVGSVSGGLDKSYVDWKTKHGQSVNTTLEDNAMRSGLIKDKVGKWRLNSTDHNTKVKQVDGKSYFASKDGVWRNFDTGLKVSEQNKYDSINRDKKLSKLRYGNSNESLGDKIKNHGIIQGLLDTGFDAANVSKDSGWRTAASLLSTGLYTIPIGGMLLSLGDAGLAAARGDWTDAALSVGMGLVPLTSGLRSLKTLNRALGNNKVGLIDKVTSKVFRRPALTKSQKAINELNRVSPAVNDVYSATQYLKNAKNPLSRLHIIGKHNINVGEKTARALELANNGWVNAGLIAGAVGEGLYKDYKVQNQYETQQQNNMLKQFESDSDSGVLFGRMSNQDFNSIAGEENKIDNNTYNQLREYVVQ